MVKNIKLCLQYNPNTSYVNLHFIVCCVLFCRLVLSVNIGSGNGLLPDITKPWPEPTLLQVLRRPCHCSDVIMSAIAFGFTGITIVCSTLSPCADQRKHQRSASLAFVRGIHQWPLNSPHKGPVTRKMFPFDDVIMRWPGPLPTTRHWKTKTTKSYQSIVKCLYTRNKTRHTYGRIYKSVIIFKPRWQW